MQLHRLSVTAFGPFADTQHVDFDALADGGLFLFHGPTGAGKTSILDAVCFAFYGQVPGARAASRSLRSDHADPGARPEVVLEATVRGRRIRLSRSPVWERPKLRGSGTTTEQARVHLQECQAGDWTTRSTRLDETGLQVRTLLGLDMTQFCQVVLLPQGQFAEFLRADADRRRALLESLFDTERFADVERWLVERRKVSLRALDEADQRVAHVVARVAEAAGAELPTELAPEQMPSWVAGLLATARAELRSATAVAEAAVRAREAAATTLAAATRLRDLKARRHQLVSRQQGLLARNGERDAAATELEAARTVAPILPMLAEVGRLQTELEAARAEAIGAHQRVAGFLAATGTSEASAMAVAPDLAGFSDIDLPSAGAVVRSSSAARSEIGSLLRLADQEVEADQLVRDIDELERAIVAVEAETAEVTSWLGTATERRSALDRVREQARDAAAELSMLREGHVLARSRLAAAHRRQALADDVVVAGDDVRHRTDVAQQARESWLGLRQLRLDGMAAELASGLVEGDSCPVCGSADHPTPASTGQDAVTREQEELASRRAADAETERGKAHAWRSTLEVELAEARAAAGGETAVAVLVTAAATLGARLEVVESTAATLAGAEAAVSGFDQERERQVRQQVRLAQQAQEARVRAEEAQARLTRLQTVLAEARGADPSIAARAARLARLADDCDRLAAQVTDMERLHSAVGAALRRAERAAAQHDLSSLDAVAAAARDEARIVELDEFRQRHDAEQASLVALLADPEVAAVTELPDPDLAELSTTAQTADAVHAQTVAVLTGAGTRVAALDRLHRRLREVTSDREPLAADYRTVDGLSRLAEGKSADNRLRMSLSGYVLAARLEQVAAAASERLERMSSGRYRLVHTAEGAGGRGRGGLHLRVLDSWTGADRDPATLSGGESFSASLALALGLADVVTSESGGALLETLFVDEGFGTLDEETLDEVMGVLDDLRDGGRVVGLVSHVADLRQRVPVQLQVHKGRGGSTISQ